MQVAIENCKGYIVVTEREINSRLENEGIARTAETGVS